MSSIRNIVPTSLITLAVLILTFDLQSRVFAAEQKPESPLWQISSTHEPEISTKSSSFNTTTSIRPTTSSTKLPTSSSKPSNSNTHNTARDEIYIDDDGLEGSGGRGEIHDDLEKEPEYSGSGFGDDDEDSSSSTIHQRKKGYKSNTGNSGYKPINSKNKEPITDTEINKHPEKPKFPIDNDNDDDDDDDNDDDDDDDLEMGSGQTGINRNRNDNDDSDNDGFDSNTHQIVPTRKEEGDIDIPSGKPDINIDGNRDEDDNEDDLMTTIDEKINTTDEISIDKPNTGTDTDDLNSGEGNEIDLDKTGKSDTPTDKPSSGIEQNHTPPGSEVFIMDNRAEDRTASFFAQPGILAAVIGGAVVGLLCAILVVMFIVYRMRKKDEGSYALDEPKRSPAVNSYAKNANNREFYA